MWWYCEKLVCARNGTSLYCSVTFNPLRNSSECIHNHLDCEHPVVQWRRLNLGETAIKPWGNCKQSILPTEIALTNALLLLYIGCNIQRNKNKQVVDFKVPAVYISIYYWINNSKLTVIIFWFLIFAVSLLSPKQCTINILFIIEICLIVECI